MNDSSTCYYDQYFDDPAWKINNDTPKACDATVPSFQFNDIPECCNTTMVQCENIYICPTCHRVVDNWMITNESFSLECGVCSSKIQYTRSAYFNKWLMRILGADTHHTHWQQNPRGLNRFDQYFCAHPEHMDWLSYEEIRMVIDRFNLIDHVFTHNKPQRRKNFFSYSVVLQCILDDLKLSAKIPFPAHTLNLSNKRTQAKQVALITTILHGKIPD